MNKPIILTDQKRRKGRVTSHKETLVDVSGIKPGGVMRIEDTLEYKHPECYFGGFTDPTDRQERFTRASEGLLSHLKQYFPEVYCKSSVRPVRDNLYGDIQNLVAGYFTQRFIWKICPSKLATLELGMMSADLKCHDERVYDTLNDILEDRKNNFLKVINFPDNATVVVKY